MPRLRNLTAQTFGRLTVIERGQNDARGRACWWCQCACGNRRLVPSWSIISGNTKSCGCLHKELARQRRLIHGMRKSPEYYIWYAMRQRCRDPHVQSYVNYGGRGITVCERWLHSFENFYADMGPRPSPTHTIERKNNDGPYSPDNTIWLPKALQHRNKRNNRLITLHGQTACLTEWLHRTRISLTTFYRRVRNGWSEQEALTIPPDPRYATKKPRKTIQP
jgi:hypothetical protein